MDRDRYINTIPQGKYQNITGALSTKTLWYKERLKERNELEEWEKPY